MEIRGVWRSVCPATSKTKDVQVASDAAVQFHRPAALGTARMGSSLITSPHKHTVTTGLPKFSEGKDMLGI